MRSTAIAAMLATACLAPNQTHLESVESFEFRADGSGQIIDIDVKWQREAIRGSHSGFTLQTCHTREFFCLNSSANILVPRDCNYFDRESWTVNESISAARFTGLSGKKGRIDYEVTDSRSDFTITTILRFRNDGSLEGFFLTSANVDLDDSVFYRYTGDEVLSCNAL
jgi:hypothetical protein